MDVLINRYRATVVTYSPGREYPFLLHYELDGVLLDVSFPDDTAVLTEGRVTHCKCPRCLLTHPAGVRQAYRSSMPLMPPYMLSRKKGESQSTTKKCQLLART